MKQGVVKVLSFQGCRMAQEGGTNSVYTYILTALVFQFANCETTRGSKAMLNWLCDRISSIMAGCQESNLGPLHLWATGLPGWLVDLWTLGTPQLWFGAFEETQSHRDSDFFSTSTRVCPKVQPNHQPYHGDSANPKVSGLVVEKPEPSTLAASPFSQLNPLYIEVS